MSRVVLITGGSRGIGLACAQRFVALGDQVAITYNTTPPPPQFFGVKCDITDTAQVDAAFAAIEEKFGPISQASSTPTSLALFVLLNVQPKACCEPAREE